MEDSIEKAKKRQRGIQASKKRLNQALADSGLKTQAALANRIADIEGLDSAPKDLVNRIFRGASVDPISIERIAKALQVDAFQLYLSSNSPEYNQLKDNDLKNKVNEVMPSQNHGAENSSQIENIFKTDQTEDPRKTQKHSSLRDIQPEDQLRKKSIAHSNNLWKHIFHRITYKIFFIFLVFVISFIAWATFNNTQPSNNNPIKDTVTIIVDNQWPKAITPEQLKDSIAENLEDIPTNIVISTEIDNTWQLIENLKVPYALKFTTIQRGRHQAIIGYLISEHSRQTLFEYIDEYPYHAEQSQHLIDLSTQAVKDFFESTLNNQNYLGTRSLTEYLSGRDLLDQATIDEYISRSLSKFLIIKDSHPNFVPALAGACSATTLLSLVRADVDYLTDAESYCKSIEKSAITDAYSAYTIGNLRRKQGQLDEAEHYFQSAININVNYTDAYLGLASTYVDRARKNGDSEYLMQALRLVDKAADLDHQYWKIPFLEARIQYFLGDISKSISANKRSVDITPTLTNLSNLATTQFCLGDYKNARSNYLTAASLDHHDPVIEYQISTLYFFEQRYTETILHAEKYLTLAKQYGNNIYTEAMIGLADAYYFNNNFEQAKSLYEQALIKLEKEKLKSGDYALPEAESIYINIVLSKINNRQLESNQLLEKLSALEMSTSNPNASIFIVRSYALLENTQKGQLLFDQLQNSCKGFLGYPELSLFKPTPAQQI